MRCSVWANVKVDPGKSACQRRSLPIMCLWGFLRGHYFILLRRLEAVFALFLDSDKIVGFFFFIYLLSHTRAAQYCKGLHYKGKIPPVLRTIQLLRQYVWKDFLDEFQHHFTWNWEALYLIDCIYTNFGDATKYYTQMPWMWLSWNTIVSGLV